MINKDPVLKAKEIYEMHLKVSSSLTRTFNKQKTKMHALETVNFIMEETNPNSVEYSFWENVKIEILLL